MNEPCILLDEKKYTQLVWYAGIHFFFESYKFKNTWVATELKIYNQLQWIINTYLPIYL